MLGPKSDGGNTPEPEIRMERYVVGAGLFAVAGALLLGPLLSPARAQGTGFSQCVVLMTEVADRVEVMDKRAFAVPAGWTPMGGGLSWTGITARGGLVLCK